MPDVKIIFEDAFLFAVDKPAGLVVHADGRTTEATLSDFIKNKFPNLEDVGNPHTLDSGRYEKRWGILNRLDRETSGVILVAKNQEVFENLQKQFLDRTILKEYIVKVWGEINLQKLISEKKIFKTELKNFYEISEPISRHKKDPRIWVCGFTGEEGGRNTKRVAETNFEILNYDEKENTSTLKMYPKTGRTHQLRLHCRFIGHPIVGDTKYGVNGIANEHSTKQIESLLLNLETGVVKVNTENRLMLHAKSLEFLHPHIGLIIKIECDKLG